MIEPQDYKQMVLDLRRALNEGTGPYAHLTDKEAQRLLKEYEQKLEAYDHSSEGSLAERY